MIQIDSRIGSEHFKKLLDAEGQPCELARLEFGDFSFYGNGPGNQLIRIGVERKTIPDMMQSIRSDRYSGHQLPGMLKMYTVRYLLLEGTTRRIHDKKSPKYGNLEFQKNDFDWTAGYGVPWNWYAFYSAITTFENCGIHRLETRNQSDSVFRLIGLYHWWQKPWDKHSAHITIKMPLFDIEGANDTSKAGRAIGLSIGEANRAGAVWGKPAAMFAAPMEDWYLKGVVKTMKAAEKIWKQIH